MKVKPLVSVIIPAYNAGAVINATVHSALNQTYNPIEILVTDDGSSDNTLDVLNGFGGAITVFSQGNRGVSHARNRGIEAARGDLIAFLDADDIWLPSKIDKQVEQFNKDTGLGFVYTRVQYQSKQDLPHDYDIKPKFYRGFVLRELFCYPFIATSTVMVRSECLRKVGLFDVENPSNQDYDLWLRLASKYMADYLNEPLVIYNLSAGSISWYRTKMLKWTLYVIEQQLKRTPEPFRDFPLTFYNLTNNVFIKSLVLALFRLCKTRDARTARNMLRKYVSTYWRKLPGLIFARNEPEHQSRIKKEEIPL